MSRHSTTWDPSTDPDAEARGFVPPRTRRLWRDTLLPRTTFPLFWAAWLILLPARIGRRGPSHAERRVLIESGRVGWTHVFFEELWQSAAEYVGEQALVRAVIDRDLPYLPQFRAWSGQPGLTHAVIDTRTGSQTWRRMLADSLVMSWRLTRARVTPVVILPDPSLRRQRLFAAVITAHAGVVASFMSTDLSTRMFPHHRIVGPLPMPVSVSRLEALESVRAGVEAEAPGPDAPMKVSFIGGMYPPRSVFLERLAPRLAEHGVELDIHADKYQTSNDDYWRVLATSDVIITTTMQGMPRADMDWIWIQQLVFRFSEALSAGAVLVSPEVPGADRFFTPGEDFRSYVSVDDAVAALVALAADPEERARIRRQGHDTAVRLVHEHAFWAVVDGMLARSAMVEVR